MTRNRIYLIALIVAVACMASAGAVDEVNVTFEGHFGGETGVVAVSGNYAYIGQGQDLVVLDISSPALPVESGRVMTPSIMDVAVSGDYAYIADGSNGLTIIWISAANQHRHLQEVMAPQDRHGALLYHVVMRT